MTIEKVISIQGIGLLHDALPKALDLRKVNVIYAENGRGKSTFAGVCRSLSSGDVDSILKRPSIKGNLPARVSVRVDNTKCELRNGAWSGIRPKILVFDNEFVERNVCLGSRVDPEHRENLLEFAIGEQGVYIKNEIDKITDEVERINRETHNLEKVISQHIGPYKLDDFVQLEPSQDIDSHLEQCKKRMSDANKESEILQRPHVNTVNLPEIDIDGIGNLLQASIANIANDAERKVKEHIENHLQSGGEDWIQQGLKYLSNGNNCPFCSQTIQEVDLVSAYKAYFSASYENLKRQIYEARKRVETVLADAEWAKVREVLRVNATTKIAWNDQPNLSFPGIGENEIECVWQSLYGTLVTLLDAKARDPLSILDLNDDANEAYARFMHVKETITAYNKEVFEVNADIDELKASLKTTDILALQIEIQKLETQRKRQETEINEYCQSFLTLANEKRRLEEQKVRYREEFNSYTQDVLGKYSETINIVLAQFNAGFRIEINVEHKRGTPRTNYGLRIMDEAVSIQGSLADILSDGDKRTLALAFFLSRAKTEGDLQNFVVVVDDPVSSFDANRRRATRDELIDLSEQCSQIIILSHDAVFLCDFVSHVKDVQKWQSLQINRSGDYSQIVSCDIHRMTRDEYYKIYEELVDYLNQGPSDNENEVADHLRVYLEYNLRNRFPSELEGLRSLGEMIAQIRGNPNAFGSLGGRLADLEKINDFSSPFHHGSGDRPAKPLDAELRSMVQLALAIGRG